MTTQTATLTYLGTASGSEPGVTVAYLFSVQFPDVPAGSFLSRATTTVTTNTFQAKFFAYPTLADQTSLYSGAGRGDFVAVNTNGNAAYILQVEEVDSSSGGGAQPTFVRANTAVTRTFPDATGGGPTTGTLRIVGTQNTLDNDFYYGFNARLVTAVFNDTTFAIVVSTVGNPEGVYYALFQTDGDVGVTLLGGGKQLLYADLNPPYYSDAAKVSPGVVDIYGSTSNGDVVTRLTLSGTTLSHVGPSPAVDGRPFQTILEARRFLNGHRYGFTEYSGSTLGVQATETDNDNSAIVFDSSNIVQLPQVPGGHTVTPGSRMFTPQGAILTEHHMTIAAFVHGPTGADNSVAVGLVLRGAAGTPPDPDQPIIEYLGDGPYQPPRVAKHGGARGDLSFRRNQ